MRHGLLGSIAVLAAGAGLAFGQGPRPGPVLQDAPPAVAPSPLGQPAPMFDPSNGPSPYGPDGAPLSTAEGLFGSGPIDARAIDRCWARGEYLIWAVKTEPNPIPLIVRSE